MILRRTKTKVTERHVKGELQEGFDHLRSAAAIAAERAAERISPAMDSARATARERVGPRVEQARMAAGRAWEAALTPGMETAEDARRMSRRARRRARAAGMEAARRSRRARPTLRGERPKRRRWRWLLGALGMGAAIGAIGALISKRRAPTWEEYETGGSMGTDTSTGSGTTREKVTDMADAARRKTGEAMETARQKTSEAVQAARSRTSTAKKRVGETPEDRPISEPTITEPAVTGPTVGPRRTEPPTDRPPGI